MNLTDKARTAIQTAIPTHASGRYAVDPTTHHATRRVLVREGLVTEDGWSLTDKGEELRKELTGQVRPELRVSVTWSYRNGDTVWGPYQSRSDFDAEKYARGMVETLAKQGTRTELIRNTRTAGETVTRTATVVESHNAPQTETEPRPVPGRRISVHYHTDREEMNAAIADADARIYGAEDPAAAHVKAEREHLAKREESWERSGMDGALTQYAHGLMAQQERLAARIAEKGGMWEFPALFDLSGNLVPARQVSGRYGFSWRLLDANGRGIGWFNESQARKAENRRAAHARKGYYVGIVRVPAVSELDGGGVGTVTAIAKRTDNGWSPDAVIVDNGIGEPSAETLRLRTLFTL